MMTSGDNSWKSLVPGCFGMADLRFARHPLDEQRAKNMVKEAKRSGSSQEEIIAEIREYLASEGASSEHIDNEVKYVHNLS
jgi:hypothetical protein